ncbi:MAG: hypothetical protein JXA21_24985 [Anaerolineae bacterium]|nr:hypothetical protein [Anaerolineae bacterium]
MNNRKKVLGLVIWVLVIGVLGWLPTWGEAQMSQPVQSATWTAVFTDTFTTLSPGWTIIDDVNGQYHWGTTAYTRTEGTLVISDTGLWAAGGGTLGSGQSWPTGTYPPQMLTWAIIGPFTPTQKVWDMQVRFWLDNRLASGDAVFVGLSKDGVRFQGIELTDTFTMAQEVVWTTRAFGDAPVWLGLSFSSKDENVAAGPLIDDLRLLFNDGTSTYLSLVLREPTSTPTPTLTPTPTPTVTPTPTEIPIYIENFDDPQSGWTVGKALRYNRWPPPDFPNEGWEEVADISYHLGNYRFYVPLTWHGGGDVDTWFVWPAEKAPMPAWAYPLADRYCVEAQGKFANSWEDYSPWWAHWGLVFGANAEMTELYTFQVNANHNYAVLHYHNYLYPGNIQPLDGQEVNVENRIVPWGDKDLGNLIETAKYNTLKAVVRGNTVDIYVDDQKLETASIPNMPRANVGLIGGSFEVTPVELWFEYFKYDPLCPEAQQ